jgi:3-hydroxyisobutyrate dehydrogenase-like beta-hydroxyacid dehydrogenase
LHTQDQESAEEDGVTTDTIGFVGLGRMGALMAERFLKAGRQLVVYDTNASQSAALGQMGAVVATSPRDVADTAEVVLSCLPNQKIATDVALGEEAIAHGRAVRLYIDTATIGLKAAQTIATSLPDHIAFVDAPVSGGPAGAKAGTLSTMVSGPKAAFDRAHPMLSIFAKNIFHIGEQPGQAQLAKLINNHLSTAGRIATFEGLVLGMKAGINPMALIDVLNNSTGRNHTTSDKVINAVRSGQFAYGARLGTSIKDERLLQEEAAELGVPLWIAPHLLETLEEAAAAGYIDQDSMSLIEYMGSLAGIDARSIMEGAT